jgi:hypothetical protein
VTADLPPLEEVLAEHGLAGVREEPFPNDGWSGATMTLLRRADGERFILKRDSLAGDWIAAATNDGPVLREAWFAARGPALPPSIRAPYLGAGADGEGFGILMPDLSDVLFDWDAPILLDALDRVLAGMADLHSHRWPATGELGDGPWCPLRERITLICRASLERPGAARDAVADRILPGWDAFDLLATAAARDLINDLGLDPEPLLAALANLPATLLHGDLKLANAGIAADGTIEVVDWQMTCIAPVAVEIGWFLVSNVASLPVRAADLLAGYQGRLAGLGRPDLLDDRGADAAILVGLLLRGWRKGFDAEAGMTLASGEPAVDDLAWWCDRAVEAGRRIL